MTYSPFELIVTGVVVGSVIALYFILPEEG
jgi:hypothetical protein